MTTLDLHRAAIAADDAFETALQAAGFTRWQDWPISDTLIATYRAKLAADAALYDVYAKLNEIRRNAHCE